MKHQQIKSIQKLYGYDGQQESITTGLVWKMEGSAGRAAMDLLEAGICMLPKERLKDYWGSTVPSRDDLEPGSKGTFKNCAEFWGDPDNYENMEEIDNPSVKCEDCICISCVGSCPAPCDQDHPEKCPQAYMECKCYKED